MATATVRPISELSETPCKLLCRAEGVSRLDLIHISLLDDSILHLREALAEAVHERGLLPASPLRLG